MGFGKRATTVTTATSPATNGRESDAGVAPLDLGPGAVAEGHLTPNAASIDARLKSGRAALEIRTAGAIVKARLRFPTAELRPFFLIPDPCWNGPSGAFLMTSLDLYPCDDWNVMFLAADDATAEALEIAIHPDRDVPGFVEAAEKLFSQLKLAMSRAHTEAGVTYDFAAYQEFREDVRLKVKGLAMSFSRVVVETWERRSP